MLIDTHSHLYDEAFDEDRDEALARAEAAGVELILLPAIDTESYERQEALATARPDLFRQMMGLHPTSVNADFEADLAIAKELLFAHPEHYVGVGEIGLDLYWDTTFVEQQLDVLERQIVWAEQLQKPVVLHLRNAKESGDGDAYELLYKLLQHHGSCSYRGILHCYSGTLEQALIGVEMGFLLGIGGTVTYKKSALPDIVAALPLEKLVLETDSPYLAPVPHRGHRNESAYVAHVASKVAEIKGVSVETVAAATTQNARHLFGL